MVDHRGQSTTVESFLQALRAKMTLGVSRISHSSSDISFLPHSQLGQISGNAKATEALADNAPFALILGIILGQAFTNSFTVIDNAVCAEILQVFCLFNGVAVAS